MRPRTVLWVSCAACGAPYEASSLLRYRIRKNPRRRCYCTRRCFQDALRAAASSGTDRGGLAAQAPGHLDGEAQGLDRPGAHESAGAAVTSPVLGECPDCDGSGWIEDESDWQDADAVDPKTGAAAYPLVPCPTCNPGGQGALY